MKINIKEIVKGNSNGQKVWICDFRVTNYGNSKPIRHVKPTRVLIASNSELPKNKTVYYSESHFIKLNKKGEPLKSGIIAPFDNTGFRSRTGDPVNVFTEESECVTFYKKQCNIVLAGWRVRLSEECEFIENQMKAIKDNMNC